MLAPVTPFVLLIFTLTLALSFSTSVGLLGTVGQLGQFPVEGTLDSLHDLVVGPHHIRQIIGNTQIVGRTMDNITFTGRSIFPDVLPVAFKTKPIAQGNLGVLECFGIIAKHNPGRLPSGRKLIASKI